MPRPNLHLEIEKDKRLREELLQRWPDLADDTETLADTLDGVSSLDDAIAAVLRSGREDLAVAKALGEQIDRMLNRKARLIERAERKKAIALWATTEAGRRRVDAPDFIAYVAMGQAKVIIADETKVPKEYMRTKTTEEPNRKDIGAELRSGKDLGWAYLSNPEPYLVIKDS